MAIPRERSSYLKLEEYKRISRHERTLNICSFEKEIKENLIIRR
jgi:hypothetical protein